MYPVNKIEISGGSVSLLADICGFLADLMHPK
jgi:hypothetical protein